MYTHTYVCVNPKDTQWSEPTKTHSVGALQGITEQAGVNEIVITANSICHWDQSRPEATHHFRCTHSRVCVRLCMSMSKEVTSLNGNRRSEFFDRLPPRDSDGPRV